MRLTWLNLIWVLGLLLALSTPATAAPGYTYESIRVDSNGSFEILNTRQAAINNVGQVAYGSIEQRGFSTGIFRVYLKNSGQPAVEIWEGMQTQAETGQFIQPTSPIGINDDGVIAIPFLWNEYDQNGTFVSQESGYGLYREGQGLIRELRNNGLNSSSGEVNRALQMAGYRFLGLNTSSAIVTDGISTQSSISLLPSNRVAVNESSTVAYSAISTANNRVIVYGNPPNVLQAVSIGDANALGYTSFGLTPGLNDNGWMSFATANDNFNGNPNPRVMKISPSGDVFILAEANSSPFVNFFQARSGAGVPGVSINNLNRVSFVGQTADGSHLWIGDASGDEARLVAGNEVDFTDGTRFNNSNGFSNDVTNHGATSLNDRGEILLGVLGIHLDANGNQLASSVRALFIARPATGLEPGDPILPNPGDALPGPSGGFRFERRCPNGCAVVAPGNRVIRPRIFYDPPIAIGYDYSIDTNSIGGFESALVPTALPNGDADFTVIVNGQSAPLTAGQVFNFSDLTSEPVRTFRIADIDTAEALDPDDATVFVTGLVFSEDAAQNLTFTMVPVVEDTDDVDNDGIGDSFDNCPSIPNIDQLDTDGDGVGNACDNCLETSNPDQADTDQDGTGDVCEVVISDRDGDGVEDGLDNCPDSSNTNQEDNDGDGVGNVCDICVDAFNPDQLDTDNNGIGDACEIATPDADGDGVEDALDNCPNTPNADQADTDGDGVGDACDNCANDANADQADDDNNGIGNVCELIPQPELAVVDLVQVSRRRVGRTLFEYVYQARIQNSGGDAEQSTAILTSSASSTQIVDGTLSFPAITAGATITTSDTITIRQNRRMVFNPNDLQWSFSIGNTN